MNQWDWHSISWASTAGVRSSEGTATGPGRSPRLPDLDLPLQPHIHVVLGIRPLALLPGVLLVVLLRLRSRKSDSRPAQRVLPELVPSASRLAQHCPALPSAVTTSPPCTLHPAGALKLDCSLPHLAKACNLLKAIETELKGSSNQGDSVKGKGGRGGGGWRVRAAAGHRLSWAAAHVWARRAAAPAGPRTYGRAAWSSSIPSCSAERGGCWERGWQPGQAVFAPKRQDGSGVRANERACARP